MRKTGSMFLAVGVLVALGCAGKDSAEAVGSTDDSGAAHGTDGTDGTEDTDDTDGPDIPDGTLEEVLPIIDAHCVACHGAASPAAGLDLETDFCGTVVDGRLVVPGSTGESLMYRRMTSEDSPMPPTGALELDVIRPVGVWILEGASCE